MTLIVEDGSLVPGADSFVSLAEADSYLAKRGRGNWPPAPAQGTDPETTRKQAALIRAADYLNGLNWKGRKLSGRVLAWPRAEVVDEDGRAVPETEVPEAVRAAACRLAELILSGTELQPLLPRGGAIKSESAGTLSVTYESGADYRDLPSFLPDLLKGLTLTKDEETAATVSAALTIHRAVTA